MQLDRFESALASSNFFMDENPINNKYLNTLNTSWHLYNLWKFLDLENYME